MVSNQRYFKTHWARAGEKIHSTVDLRRPQGALRPGSASGHDPPSADHSDAGRRATSRLEGAAGGPLNNAGASRKIPFHLSCRFFTPKGRIVETSRPFMFGNLNRPLVLTRLPWGLPPVSLVAHLLLMVGAAGAVFVVGLAVQGNLGVFLVVAGVALLACPPQCRVEGRIWGVAAALLISVSLAFLPHSWFPEPGWRHSLIAAGAPFPASVTPMPRETGFWLAVFALAVAIGLYALAHPLRSRMQLGLAVAGAAICAGYAGLSLVVQFTGWDYAFDHSRARFGFFRNINQTSTYLVTGILLALAVLGVAFRGRHWFAGSVAAVCLAVCATSLFFFTSSRGGIIALLAGAVLWFLGIGKANRSKPLWVSFTAVLIASFALFLASESPARQRLLELMGIAKSDGSRPSQAMQAPSPDTAEGTDLPRDGRILIASDTARVIRDYPLTGTGLGTFRHVFPQYRERCLWDTVPMHPESDWLLLAAEGGIPSVVLFGVGVGLLIRRVWPWREHPYWPLRWGILCAGFAALLHGFVDVPVHVTALGWWILGIFGLGFQIVPKAPAASPSRLQHAFFVVAGLGALSLGLPLVRAQWFWTPFWPPTAADVAEVEVIELRLTGRLQEAREACELAIRRYPLGDRLYSQLAVTLLALKSDESAVDAAFKTGRLANPVPPDLALDQGRVWIDSDPRKTAGLWQEALRRQERIAQQQGRGEVPVLALFDSLVREAAEYPELQRRLLLSNEHRPAFVLVWLERATPAVAKAEFSRMASAPGFLDKLAEEGRRRFLQAWYGKGDREAVFRFAAERPDWERAAWPIQVGRMIDAGKYKEATVAVAGRYQIDLHLPPPGSGDVTSPVGGSKDLSASFYEAWGRGNTITARRVLAEARTSRSVPPEVWRLSAAVSAHDGKWSDAWASLERHLRESGRGSWP